MTIQNIPLSSLIPSPKGVRRAKPGAGSIAELAANIDAIGLQQNLVVRKEGKHYEVIAGNRRLAALQSLAKAGKLKAAHPVPCQVRSGSKDADLEVALSENSVREQMHPADQFEAFSKLVAQGMSTADIAARFGRSPEAVERLLKLSRVSPTILKSYREGGVTLEHVQAYALSDDHKAQERVFKSMKGGGWGTEPRDIREKLTEKEITSDDERVKLVGLDAYEKAGGKVRRDLFSDIEDEDGGFPSGYVEDPALLDKLVDAKLQHVATSIKGEGWKWIEVQPGYHEYSGTFQKLNPSNYKDKKYTAADKSKAGAVVAMSRDGKAVIFRGLVKPEDQKAAKGAKAKKSAKAGSGKGEASEAAGLSQNLVMELTAQKSAALAAVLIGKPDVALRAVVHALALETLDKDMRGHYGSDALKITTKGQGFELVEGSPALKAIEVAQKAWHAKLPPAGKKGDWEAKLWGWCLAASQAELLELLALCAALTVDTVCRYKYDAEDPDGERIAEAAGLDMRQWFTPTAENYFGRVSKDLTLGALQEALPQTDVEIQGPRWAKLKKGELAAVAEKETAGRGWLPEILRVKGVAPIPGPSPQRPGEGSTTKTASDPDGFDGRELPPDPTVGSGRVKAGHPTNPSGVKGDGSPDFHAKKKTRAAGKRASVVTPGPQGSVTVNDGVAPGELAARDQQLADMLKRDANPFNNTPVPGVDDVAGGEPDPVLAAINTAVLNAENPGGVCRVCGCTNERGCRLEGIVDDESCRWVEVAGKDSLCSNAACVDAWRAMMADNGEQPGEVSP